jgi:RIO kinase 2
MPGSDEENEDTDSVDSDNDDRNDSDLQLEDRSECTGTSESSNSNKFENVENFQIIADNTKDLNNESESEDELEDLSISNREYKPFRNEESMDHVNTHLNTQSRQRNSDSMYSATSSIMPPDLIKEKVKRQMKSTKQKQEARRIRKSGEASLATRKKRDTQNDIEQSMGAVWGL